MKWVLVLQKSSWFDPYTLRDIRWHARADIHSMNMILPNALSQIWQQLIGKYDISSNFY